MLFVREADRVRIAQRFYRWGSVVKSKQSAKRTAENQAGILEKPSISAVRYTDYLINLDLIPALRCCAIFISSALRTIPITPFWAKLSRGACSFDFVFIVFQVISCNKSLSRSPALFGLWFTRASSSGFMRPGPDHLMRSRRTRELPPGSMKSIRKNLTMVWNSSVASSFTRRARASIPAR